MAKSVKKAIAEIDAFREDRIALVMLQDIALSLIATPEPEYLSGFVEAAGQAMGADMVLVSRIRSPEEPVTAIAIYDRSGQASHYEYPLRGTPCEQVFIDNQPFVMGCGLQEAFPSDEDLGAFGLNSYVGMPLFHEGKCFGLVAALFRAENPPSEPILKVFKHVEDRIASGIRAYDAIQAERLELRGQVAHGRKRLEIALGASGIGVWEYDMTAGSTRWDDRMCELYGVPWQGEIVKPEEWLKFIHPDDLEAVWGNTLRAVQDRKPYQIEFRILRLGGAVRTLRSVGQYVEIEGANPGFIGCDRDITDDMALAV
ncbi:MAG: PAS domain-containing protein [Maricaulis sp.]|nr:PAS domain-containing protein [Maricaulis sp.]MDG2044368.1 PAS domain-containing protein [Maricaulis sp.]